MSKLKVITASVVLACVSACATHPLSSDRTIATPYVLTEDTVEAPYGGAVSDDLVNYSRAAPYVAIAGKLNGNGVTEAQSLGFKLIIDLRRPDEDGVTEEMAEVDRLGIAYENVPLAKDQTAWDQVDRVTQLLSDRANYPVLIHCGSANRAGAVWALYRTKQGVPSLIAIEEGRAVGLKSREAQVRELLELPAP